MFYPLNYEGPRSILAPLICTRYSIGASPITVNLMSSSLLITLLAIGAVGAGLYVLIIRKIKEMFVQRDDSTAIRLINDNIQGMNERLNDRLTEAARYIGGLRQQLHSVEALRDVLISPKLRGNFGERMLYDMLANHFPKDHYVEQYKFRDGQTVDAMLRTKDGLIPIDSKFPIDNFRKMTAAQSDEERSYEKNEFQKAVRKHIADISKKYILPGEGTVNFAVMYVPSEAVFYEIISGSEELSELAQRSRVLMTSPNTMSYFLHILRLGHERIRIEENVQKVWEMLSGFQQETVKFGEALGVLSRHVTNARGAMDSVVNEYGKLSAKIDQIKQLK